MADRYSEPNLGVRLLQEDHKWLVLSGNNKGMSVHLVDSHAVWHFRNWQEEGRNLLEEALEVIDYLHRVYQKQVRRQRYVQRKYQNQLRFERNLRRAHERRLRHERNMRRAYELRLRDERARRRAYEEQLRRQRDYYDRPIEATETNNHVLYGPKVAKLLDLAVCSDSDGEARAALAKARALHRLVVLSPPEAQESGTPYS